MGSTWSSLLGEWMRRRKGSEVQCRAGCGARGAQPAVSGGAASGGSPISSESEACGPSDQPRAQCGPLKCRQSSPFSPGRSEEREDGQEAGSPAGTPPCHHSHELCSLGGPKPLAWSSCDADSPAAALLCVSIRHSFPSFDLKAVASNHLKNRAITTKNAYRSNHQSSMKSFRYTNRGRTRPMVGGLVRFALSSPHSGKLPAAAALMHGLAGESQRLFKERSWCLAPSQPWWHCGQSRTSAGGPTWQCFVAACGGQLTARRCEAHWRGRQQSREAQHAGPASSGSRRPLDSFARQLPFSPSPHLCWVAVGVQRGGGVRLDFGQAVEQGCHVEAGDIDSRRGERWGRRSGLGAGWVGGRVLRHGAAGPEVGCRQGSRAELARQQAEGWRHLGG